ncbi:MAG TPA: hypothetical protein VNT79_16595, partial [Phycisphaerae bacterium]|nr:hypothetical protein [Phycisphaerae bacterium]
ILRGDAAENLPTSESAEHTEAVVKADEPPRTIQQTSDMIQQNRETAERLRIEFARREREIQDGFALWEARQLALLREKESFEEEKRRFTAEREELAKATGDSGVQKEMETLAGIPAKAAKELLLAKEEADATRILKAMDQRKLNKIVKECKTEEERQWIGRILEQFHESSTAKAEDLDAG